MYFFDLEEQVNTFQQVHHFPFLKVLSLTCVPIIMWSSLVMLHQVGDLARHATLFYCMYFMFMEFWAGITFLPFIWMALKTAGFYSKQSNSIIWCVKLQLSAWAVYLFALTLLSDTSKTLFQYALNTVTATPLIVWKEVLHILL
jgi:hypothetical protein